MGFFTPKKAFKQEVILNPTCIGAAILLLYRLVTPKE